MMLLENFHFLRPAWLLLAPVVVWIWRLDRTHQDPLRGWRALIHGELLAAMTVHAQPAAAPESHGFWGRLRAWVEHLRSVSLLAAGLIAVLALAGPAWQLEPSPFADDLAPLMLVLHAGESMNSADLLPSRMERARLKAADLTAERPGLPLGLIAYAGTAHLVLPPTRDTAIVATLAAEIEPTVMPRPGNDLPAALRLAAKTLGEAGGSIVVLADSAPSLDEAAWRRVRDDCPHTIQFLSVTPARTSDNRSADRGGADQASLEQAAAALGARVAALTPDSTDVRTLVRRAASAPVTITSAADGARWSEAGWWLVPVLALFSLASFRRERGEAERKRTSE